MQAQGWTKGHSLCYKVQAGKDVVLTMEPGPAQTLASLLEQMGIPAGEIGHIFCNGKLLVTRTTMAPYYGYPQERDSVFDWNLDLPVGDGDRIGLFGSDLPILGM